MTDTVLEPRIARTRELVFAATLEIIAERGFAGASIEAIAQRAGVARSTIYRNWPTRVDLLLEAVGSAVGRIESLTVGDLRTDLVTLVSHLADLLSFEPMGSVAAALILESRQYPDLDALRIRFVAQRRLAVEQVMSAAIARGELPADTDVHQTGADLSAPVFFQALVLRAPIDDPWVEDQVDRWLERYDPA